MASRQDEEIRILSMNEPQIQSIPQKKRCKHQHKQKHKNPKRRISLGIIIYCVQTCLSCLYLQTQYFYPMMADLSEARILTFFSYFIVAMALWSYFQTILIKNAIPKLKDVPQIMESDEELDINYLSDFCQSCQYFKLPRVSHCSKCGICTMKMDHHCVWTQNCIGFRNQRAFYLFSLYMTLGLIQFWFATFHAYDRIYEIKQGFPIYVSILWLVTCLSAFFVGIMILVLWSSHTMMILTNHTTMLSMKNREVFPLPFCQHRKSKREIPEEALNSFDRGQIQNVRNIFGTSGILMALIPRKREPENDFIFEPDTPTPTQYQKAKFTGFLYEEPQIQEELGRLFSKQKTAQIMKGKRILLNGQIIQV